MFRIMNPCRLKLTLTRSADKALDRPDISSRTRDSCLQSLYRMCSRYALLPTSLKIPVSYERADDVPYRGGFADVWKREHCGRDVAVKVIRIYSDSDLQRVVGVRCWLCFLPTCLYADSVLCRSSAKRSSDGKPSGIQMSCH